MDKNMFLKVYWRNYISIEKEFIKTLEYITLDTENYEAFSSAYIKLLLQIGSEVDITAKLLCNQYNEKNKVENIDDYRQEIMLSEKAFADTRVNIIFNCDIPSFKPWESWNNNNSPDWWKVYNKVKHERMGTGIIANKKNDYYKFANLRNTLFALGGLYQLLLYSYSKLVDLTEWIKLPMPGSHLFTLSGDKWDKMTFFQDVALYYNPEDGHLYCKTGIY